MIRFQKAPRKAQSGFSLVEMLMAAFILAIGLLGLAMLEILSLRANLGSSSLTTAVTLGNRILDAAAAEGRFSWSNMTALAPITLNPARYLDPTGAKATTEYYDLRGGALADQTGSIFTASVVNAPQLAAGAGRTTLVTVTITFIDQANPTNPSQVLKRSVVLSRSVKSA